MDADHHADPDPRADKGEAVTTLTDRLPVTVIVIHWPKDQDGHVVRDTSKAIAKEISRRLEGTEVDVQTYGTIREGADT